MVLSGPLPRMRSPRIVRAELLIDAVAGCALGVAMAVAVTGDAQVALPGLVLRARGASRALAIGSVAACVRFALVARAGGAARLDGAAHAIYRIVLTAMLSSALMLVAANRITSCGGLDSAGYLGAARLFLSGRVIEPQPVARVLPFPEATSASAPLGFVASAAPFHIAPRFPPGLPLMMAAAIALAGDAAPFLVPSALAIGCVLLVYAMTRRLEGDPAAALAAAFTASSPVFLGMAIQPMSDVPATFWILLAAFLLWRSPVRASAAGLAAGMAILTRPPLILVCAVLLMTADWRERRKAVIFTLVTGAAVGVLLLLQWRMYGSAFTSGYGASRDLFTLSTLRVNVTNHAAWLLRAETPLLVVLFALGWWYAPRLAMRALAVFAATALPYLVYAPIFEDWEILRFLLPGLPFVLMVCACGVTGALHSAARPRRSRLAVSALVLAAAASSYGFLSRQNVFGLREQEQRYPLVGEWFARNTPTNAVVIGSLHTGSVHYYSRRATLRFDVLPEGRLGDTLGALRRAGYIPYLALEQGDEIESFRSRFHPDAIRNLDVQPQARIRGVYIARLNPR